MSMAESQAVGMQSPTLKVDDTAMGTNKPDMTYAEDNDTRLYRQKWHLIWRQKIFFKKKAYDYSIKIILL